MNRTAWVGIRLENIETIGESVKHYLEQNNILTIDSTVLEAVTAEGHTIGYGWVARQDRYIELCAANATFNEHIPQIRDYLASHGIVGTVTFNVDDADICHIEMWKVARNGTETIH